MGADIAWDNGLRDDDVLLVPPPFDSLYPHYLVRMTDAALGENDRYTGEQAQYNSILAELAAWLRRKNLPARGCSWRWVKEGRKDDTFEPERPEKTPGICCGCSAG